MFALVLYPLRMVFCISYLYYVRCMWYCVEYTWATYTLPTKSWVGFAREFPGDSRGDLAFPALAPSPPEATG